MIMKNNLNTNTNPLQKANVIYHYRCIIGDCALHNVSYIGETTNTLSLRITGHLQKGAPKSHTQDIHNTTLTRQQMVDNKTTV
jgi:hypothetical protein